MTSTTVQQPRLLWTAALVFSAAIVAAVASPLLALAAQIVA